MQNIAQVMAQLDPDYQRKYAEHSDNIRAKYDIAGAQMQLQRETLLFQQDQARWKREAEERQAYDRQRQENERNRVSVDIEQMRQDGAERLQDKSAASARELQDRGAQHAAEFQQRAEDVERRRAGHKAALDVLVKGAGSILESYADRRKAVFAGLEESRKNRNGMSNALINGFIQDRLSERDTRRQNEFADKEMQRQKEIMERKAMLEMDALELQHKARMAEMEMENNARFVLKAYELEGVHGAKMEIDRLVSEWQK